MPYASSRSVLKSTAEAAQEISREAVAQLAGATPDLAFLFASREHTDGFDELVQEVRQLTGCRHVLACTAETVVAGDQEIENGPALGLWCGVLPGAEFDAFHVEFERTPDGPICSGLPDAPDDIREVRGVFLLADPFSCAIDTLIGRLADDLPGVPLLGGMASGGQAPGENRLALDDRSVSGGGVGVVVHGGPRVRSIVSQGCRPIGSTYVITKSEENVIHSLGGKLALTRLEETYSGLSDEERELIRNGLHLGVVMDERKPQFSRGDFLIANVLGADRSNGAIVLASFVRNGQTVQFHVRDASTADEDLRQLLSTRLAENAAPPQGALLFSCNGRGTRLFPEPHHDARVIQELCGPIPLAGLFAQGELGPVDGRNYIHGFTASVALFD